MRDGRQFINILVHGSITCWANGNQIYDFGKIGDHKDPRAMKKEGQLDRMLRRKCIQTVCRLWRNIKPILEPIVSVTKHDIDKLVFFCRSGSIRSSWWIKYGPKGISKCLRRSQKFPHITKYDSAPPMMFLLNIFPLNLFISFLIYYRIFTASKLFHINALYILFLLHNHQHFGTRIH